MPAMGQTHLVQTHLAFTVAGICVHYEEFFDEYDSLNQLQAAAKSQFNEMRRLTGKLPMEVLEEVRFPIQL